MYSYVVKRAIDVVISAGALVVLSPLMLATAAAIKLSDPGPVIFRQQRVGRAGRPFELAKFRSMPVGTADIPSDRLASVRITWVGRFLRRSNLDELPQLWNILKGDMSLVGPRPSLPSQRELVELRSANGALACRPGLTGLAQVNAFDGMSVERKARYDGEYAANLSFGLDVSIMFRTFAYLLKPPPTY